MSLRIIPITQKEANAFIEMYHRHHPPVIGAKFCIGVMSEEKLVGALIAGRPVARGCCQVSIVEVTRLATDGTRNACSILYGAAARAAKALGYAKIQTYILSKEPGASLRASGWILEGVVRGRSWKRSDGAARSNVHPLSDKTRWVKELGNIERPLQLFEKEETPQQGFGW